MIEIAYGAVDITALIFEAMGLLVLLSSGTLALFNWFSKSMPQFIAKKKTPGANLRLEFSHQIVFALEFFIAADIIKSISRPTVEELVKLGIIVVIRTVLHYSLR